LSLWLPPKFIVLPATAVLATAHLLSPIVLTWGDKELRRRALGAPRKYVMLPLAILAVCAIIGLSAPSLPASDLNFSSVRITPDSYHNPLVVLLGIYVIWNAYHFGKQNFGVLSLYRVRGGRDRRQRAWDNWFCLTMIAAATALPFAPRTRPFEMSIEVGTIVLFVVSLAVMLPRERRLPRILFIVATALAPLLMFWWPWLAIQMHNAALASGSGAWLWAARLPYWPSLWAFALLAINHWLVAMGLAGHIFGHRHNRPQVLFVLPLLIAGAAVFALLFVDLRTLAIHVTALAIALRLGLGFVHFLYDRWLYKLSDPQVQATIGRDILRLDTGPPHSAMQSFAN
jgi:hypothetical protein